MGKADRPRIVGALGQSQGFGQERDAAGRFAACRGHPAVHPPEVGEPGRIGPLARIWRPAERLGRLAQVVLEQPGFRQSAPDPNLVVANETGLPQRADQEGRGLGPMPLLQSRERPLV